MNIVTIVGSLRQASYNMQLANTMQERYVDKMNMNITDISALPFYNQDHEQNPPQEVVAFKEAIGNCDGVIVITPEFNWSIPGVLQNAFDWSSRVDKVFVNKPVMILGTTIGSVGTIRAQTHLRQILSAPGLQANVLSPGNYEILISHADQKFAHGKFVDHELLIEIDSSVNAFIDLIKSV